jgi:hypothetical protein
MMISRTSMTSTSGVTLISALIPPPPPTFIDIVGTPIAAGGPWSARWRGITPRLRDVNYAVFLMK